MRILISGNDDFYTIASSYARAFKSLGHDVLLFADENIYWKESPYIKNRYTHRLFWKYFSISIQRRFLKVIRETQPDLIFIVKGWFYAPDTIRNIKLVNPGGRIFNWNPDNPFISKIGSNRNSWILNAIPFYDVYFSYAKYLISKFKTAGAKASMWLPCAYDEAVSYPLEVRGEEREKFSADVAFVGNWDIERESWLNHLLDYDLKIWGTVLWSRANPKLRAKWQGREAIGNDYAKVCSSAKIMINILRRQNLTSHNMKSFEIVGCRGFALMTRSQEHLEFFTEDKEAVYFSTPQELKEKISLYLINENLRKQIAEAGYKKLVVSRWNYVTRAKEVLGIYEKLRNDGI